MVMVTILGILMLVIVRIRRHNDRYACHSFSRFSRSKESTDDDSTVSISPSCPTVVGLTSTKGFPIIRMTITPPTPAQVLTRSDKLDSCKRDEVHELPFNSHSDDIVVYGARKEPDSSTFEAKSFPRSDQSQPPRTAPEGWQHVLSLSHFPNYPCRLHNSDRPSTLAHRPSPSPQRASRKSHPVQNTSLITQLSLEVWNTLLTTSQSPSCPYASRSKPRQPQLS
ncbi:hypothetical protein BDR06DRAFT_1001715 [Suillus hirtellus]|nr:hypothetical protein BDR06DRAFT_1001715 [Suillus hirtellus]